MPPPAPDAARTARKLAEIVYPSTSEEDLRVNMELVIRDALPHLPTPKYEKTVRTSTHPIENIVIPQFDPRDK